MTSENSTLKALWLSNSPWASTGYGNQTRIFTPRLKACGVDISICAFYGLEGGVINWGGIPVLPKGLMPYGQDIAAAHTRARGAQYLITLVDAWIFNDGPFYENVARDGIRWLPWFPIDSEPIPPPVLAAVQRAYRPICFSQFGVKQAKAAGLDPAYIPHGVETQAYTPRDMSESRTELREHGRFPIDDDTFLVGMVAANKGTPSRKAFPENLRAFSIFKQKHPEAVLYLHTTSGEHGEYGGMNLLEYVRSLGLEIGKDVLFPGRYDLMLGFGDPIMRTLYSAMDVFLLASSGEGFGIPIVEAQACGTPVIVGDWTATSELCFSGWKIDKTDSHPFWDVIGAYKFLPEVDAIVQKLELAYQHRGNKIYRQRAREGALAYDADTVTEKYWLPFLNSLIENDERAAEELASVRQMMTKRITPRGDPIQEGEKGEQTSSVVQPAEVPGE